MSINQFFLGVIQGMVFAVELGHKFFDGGESFLGELSDRVEFEAVF
jgi:hypothetical protein